MTTLINFALSLFGMAALILAVGFWIAIREKRKRDFWDSYIFIKEMIVNGKPSRTAYCNILEAFRDLNSCGYQDKEAHKRLTKEFLLKYGAFCKPEMIIEPDDTKGYYNYKIILQE